MMRLVLLTLSALLLLAPLSYAQDPESENAYGHSRHGAEFDVGPRQKPWVMTGIGESHFPVTTSNSGMQRWFDQGWSLLHCFWYYEAERSFRWCLKLDPECAMAYIGLARCMDAASGTRRERQVEFVRKALELRENASAREQRWIDAYAAGFLPDGAHTDPKKSISESTANRTFAKELEKYLIDYPDDLEAKSLVVLGRLGNENRLGNEAIIQDILAANPNHPGAHHYRIHVWDGKEGRVALESCQRFGELARSSGHANHMPGHIYSGIGMWHEAGIWMDRATRVEQQYMVEHMALPYHDWNYAHNRNYLSFIQEQLGLPTLALQGAWQLIAAPKDPDYNSGTGNTPFGHGRTALIRGLIKFEQWEAILHDEQIPWGDDRNASLWKNYAHTRAHLALGNRKEAKKYRDALQHIGAEQKNKEGKPESPLRGGEKTLYDRMLAECDAELAREAGDLPTAIKVVTKQAGVQLQGYRSSNDPPNYPRLLSTFLGELYLQSDLPPQAIKAFNNTLDYCPNDAFALSGLTRAYFQNGDMDAASHAYGRLKLVWADAEPGLHWMTTCEALGLESPPIDESPAVQRDYKAQTLDPLGPQIWTPYDAPRLAAIDSEGQPASLEEYRGQMVLLIFYLGEGCAHCVEQLQAVEKRQKDFAKHNIQVLAISGDSPEHHRNSELMGAMPFRLLSDSDHSNARRYQAWDDFEEIELHATILIDEQGRIRWSRIGGDPFMNMDFLLGEIRRVESNADLGRIAVLAP